MLLSPPPGDSSPSPPPRVIGAVPRAAVAGPRLDFSKLREAMTLLVIPSSEGRQERLKRWRSLLAYSQELMINSTDKIAKKRLKKKCKEVDKVIQDETDRYREEELPTILAVESFERAQDDAARRREADAIAERLQQEAYSEMEPNSSYLSSESAAGESEMELEDRHSFCSGGNFVEPPKLWKRPSYMDWKVTSPGAHASQQTLCTCIFAATGLFTRHMCVFAPTLMHCLSSHIVLVADHAIPNSKLMLKGRGQAAPQMNQEDWTDEMGIVVASNQVKPYNRRHSSIGTDSTGTGVKPSNRRSSSLQSFELDSASAQSMLDKAIFGIDNSHAKDAEVKDTMLERAKLIQAKEKFYNIDDDGTGMLGDDEVCELAWAGLLSDWLGCYHEDGPANLLPDSMWDGDGYTID